MQPFVRPARGTRIQESCLASAVCGTGVLCSARVTLPGRGPGPYTSMLAEEQSMQHLSAFAASWVMPTHTGTEALALILRWFHIIAGITWIGVLYFFNLVNVPFMKQVDAAMKPKILQYMTLPALNWFRWSALLTVFLG